MKSTFLQRLGFVLILFLGSVFNNKVHATIIYVDSAATGLNNGTSWTDAYTNFQSGVNAANAGDTVWVAKGTYQPTSGNSFSMKDSVAIFGGFAGTETNFSQRNLTLGDSSILKGNGDRVINNNGLHNSAVLDGFIITGGKNTGVTGGVFGPHGISSGGDGDGGAMYNYLSSPKLANLTFYNNIATGGSGGGNGIGGNGNGGAMYNDSSSPILNNIIFSTNSANGGLSNGTNGNGNGGAMYNSYSSPILTNVTFFNNSANGMTAPSSPGARGGSGFGGAMFNNSNSSPVFNNVIFNNNIAAGGSGFSGGGSAYGGAISNNSNSSPVLFHVTLNGNGALGGIGTCNCGGGGSAYGGAICNINSASALSYVTISNNGAGGGSGGGGSAYGGAIYNSNSSLALVNINFIGNGTNGGSSRVSAGNGFGGGIYNTNSVLTVTNATFYGNTTVGGHNIMGGYIAGGYGGGICNSGSSPVSIANSVFWDNAAMGISSGANDIDTSTSTPNITYCFTQSAITGAGNVQGMVDPFVDTTNLAGADGVYMTTDDGLHISPTSPAFNSGRNDSIPAGITKDITDTTPRIVGGTVDMGAYETTGHRWYVDSANISGTHDGKSWVTAFDSLQAAINTAGIGDSIWVAKGTYRPLSGNSFSMKDGVAIYGGFAGTETSFSQRDLSLGDSSILKGNGNRVISNSGLHNTAVLDGFIITGGYLAGVVNTSGGNASGGGMYNNNSSPELANLIFYNDSAYAVYNGGGDGTGAGGGMYNINSSPILTNITFYNNIAYGGQGGDQGGVGLGGGMYNTNSSPILKNITFFNNSANGGFGAFGAGGAEGGGLYNSNSNPKLTNVVFINNITNPGYTSTGYSFSIGGGMANSNSTPILINLTFFNNGSGGGGGGIGDINSSPIITNTVFWGNTAGSKVDIYNDNTSSPKITYSFTQSAITGAGNIQGTLDPFVTSTNPAGADGVYMTTDDGLHILPTSAAFNSGRNDSIPAAITKDITDSTPRILDSIVEMGAYETTLSAPPSITQFAPSTICGSNDTVVISGHNFAGNPSISFGGIPVSFSTVVNDSTIKAVAGNGASGNIAVTTSGGTASLAGLTYNTPLVASVSIAANPGDTICASTNVEFTATPTNGISPSYQWKLNGVNVGTNATTYDNNSLSNKDTVSCIMTSGSGCVAPVSAISNSIIVTYAIDTPTINIVSSANNICAGTNVTFTATATHSGTNPSYQWKLNGVNVGTNATTYDNDSLANKDTVSCIMTSTSGCGVPINVISDSIIMTVNAIDTPSVNIISSANNICSGSSVTFSATATHSGTTPSYQWKINNTNAGSDSTGFTTNSLANGEDTIECIVTSNAVCKSSLTDTSNDIIVTVDSTFTPSVTIVADTTKICFGTADSFTAYAINGGGSPSYQWQVNGSNTGTNDSVYTSSSLQNGNVISCLLTSSLGCTATPLSNNNITMTVYALPTVSNGMDTILLGSNVILNLSVTGNIVQYQWTPADSLDNNTIANPTANPGTDKTYTLEVTTLNGCTASGEMTVTVLSTTLAIPNAFTPNGDGYNDTWHVYDIGGSISSVDVNVYNTTGALVYHATNYQNNWDGTYNGKPLPDGTYFYHIILHYPDHDSSITNNVTIIR